MHAAPGSSLSDHSVRSEHDARFARVDPHAGFTLVELLAVLAIVAAIAVVAVPRVDASAEARLDAAAGEVAEQYRLARTLALGRDERRGIELLPTTMRIRIFRGDTATGPANRLYDVRDPVTKRIADVDLTRLEHVGVDSITYSSTFRSTCSDADRLWFMPDGTVRCGVADLVLLNQQTLFLRLGGFTRIVRLDGFTGRVTVEKA